MKTKQVRRGASSRGAVGTLQRWFQAAVMHPRGSAGASRDHTVTSLLPAAARSLDDVLLPSRQLTARQRLEVYASSYFLRLRDVMKVDHPGVFHFLGERAFDEVVREYVTLHPSTSFTLNDLGLGFARFLADEATASKVAARRAFVAELATLERALEDVFHERVAKPVDVTRLKSIPLERWNRARFKLIPASRLFAFTYPVNHYLQAVLDAQHPKPPKPAPSWVAVYRKQFRVWRARLTLEQFELLHALRGGAPLGKALERALSLPGADADFAQARLGDWFREWTSEGLFAAIDVG